LIVRLRFGLARWQLSPLRGALVNSFDFCHFVGLLVCLSTFCRAAGAISIRCFHWICRTGGS
jgi:hypothetical protein